jgi:uncharacterized OB-fold protein
MEISRHWRLRQPRLRLIGEECPHCEVKIFPPRDICPRCGRGTLKNNLDVRMGNQEVLVVNDVERRRVDTNI